jgi:hypothetical protein
VRVLNQSPNQKILLRFVEKYHHSLYLVEKLVFLGCGLLLVFLVVLFLCFCFQRIFISLQKTKVLEFVLEPSFLRALKTFSQ